VIGVTGLRAEPHGDVPANLPTIGTLTKGRRSATPRSLTLSSIFLNKTIKAEFLPI